MRRVRWIIGLMLTVVVSETRAAPPVAAVSPDGRVRIEMSLRKEDKAEAVPHYRVTFAGKEVIGYSRLGVELGVRNSLGGSCEIVAVETRSIREEYTQIMGKRRAITAHASEVVVELRESAAPRHGWQVLLRAYDDGAAFRYRFPKQDGWDTLAIKQERTEFRFPAEAKGFALPLNGFTTSYEKRYEKMPIKDLPKDWLLGLPLLVECPGRTWAAVTEANIYEYAGMGFAPKFGKKSIWRR